MFRSASRTVLLGIVVAVAAFLLALVVTRHARTDGPARTALAPAGAALQLPAPAPSPAPDGSEATTPTTVVTPTTGEPSTPAPPTTTTAPAGGGTAGGSSTSAPASTTSIPAGARTTGDAVVTTGSRLSPDSPTLRPPPGSFVTIPPPAIVELDDGVRFLDPCAGRDPADCPEGAVQSTILASTSVGPFQIVGATFAPIPGVDAGYDLCNSYYTEDRPDAATLAIYSDMPGVFTIRVSAVRRTDAAPTDGTGSTSEAAIALPRLSATTAAPQASLWTREIGRDRPNPGVVTCRQIPGIQAGDSLTIRITGTSLPALHEPYTSAGTDSFELAAAYQGAHLRQPAMILAPVSPVDLDIIIPLRTGGQATAAVLDENVRGGCAGQDAEVIPGAMALLQKEDFRVMPVPAAARQAVSRFWDPAYDTVAIGRIHLPSGFRNGAVCGFMFNRDRRLVDRQQAKIAVPSTGFNLHVDVHLRGEGTPRQVCGSCTTIDFTPFRASTSCAFRGVGYQFDYADICGATGLSSERGAMFVAHIRIRSTGPSAPAFSWDGVFDPDDLDRESAVCSAQRADHSTCRDHDSSLLGFGDLYDPNVTMVFHSRYHELPPQPWRIDPVTHPPGGNLEIPADAQAHLELAHTTVRPGADGHSIVVNWRADRPVRLAARIETPQTLSNYAACNDFPVPLAPVPSPGGLATNGTVRLAHLCANRFGFDDPATGHPLGIEYTIAVELTTENGVVSSYGSAAPVGRGHLGAGFALRLPQG